MHFPVPDINNDVGVSYRLAVVEYQGGAPIRSALQNISALEQQQLDAGEIIERTVIYNSNPSKTLSEKRADIDAIYNSKLSSVTSTIQTMLSYWGYERDIM